MWASLLVTFFERLIRTGDFYVTMPNGKTHRFGDMTGEPVRIELKTTDLPRRLIMNPDIGLGEGYMEGNVVIENDDLKALLELGMRNYRRGERLLWFQSLIRSVRRLARRIEQFNPIRRAQANVAHHYDLSGELYELFLDEDRQYSCAYFRSADDTLEQAQLNKKRHIAQKLLIEPGMKVLDIGCGWGGMAITLAKEFDAEVVGVTLSKEQHAVATERVRQAGLEGKVDIRLQDYRLVDEEFDRIVSVGMFEHVGVPHYREYFGKIRDLLKEDGIALVHTIGRTDPPGITSSWVLKYIFPGGYCPAMSEAMSAVEKELLVPTDVEVWRLHYAETLRHWYARFMANVDKARDLYDERFCRMWRFYLAASEMSFREGGMVVFQFQLARDQKAVPLTRDYLYPEQEQDQLQHAAE